MPKEKRTRPYVTLGIKRTGQLCVHLDRLAWDQAEMLHNIPHGVASTPRRPIPVLNRIGRRVAYCYAPLKYMYAPTN